MREVLRAEAYLQYQYKVEEAVSLVLVDLSGGSFPSIAVIGQEIKNIYDVAATDGTRNAARVASFFVLMGACSSLLIPGRRRETEELVEEMEGEDSDDSASGESNVVVVSEPTSQANG